jgi:hypothetical protein
MSLCLARATQHIQDYGTCSPKRSNWELGLDEAPEAIAPHQLEYANAAIGAPTTAAMIKFDHAALFFQPSAC